MPKKKTELALSLRIAELESELRQREQLIARQKSVIEYSGERGKYYYEKYQNTLGKLKDSATDRTGLKEAPALRRNRKGLMVYVENGESYVLQ